MGEFLRPADVAPLLGVSASAVRHWIRNGRLPALRTPGARGTYRIRRADAEAFVNELRVTTSKEAAA
jgi:excisionase family DNA binding protein